MVKRTTIQTSDDNGHFYQNGKLYKLERYRRNSKNPTLSLVYVEVNPEEYDERVENLVQRLLSFKGVDIVDILRDAVFDMDLTTLKRLETKLDKEVGKAREKGVEPQIETKRGDRGTCVDLRIGGKFVSVLRQ